MEARLMELRKWLQTKGELAFWLFPLGMVIDAYGDAKENHLPRIAYLACVLIEGAKLFLIVATLYFLVF